jgi:hypothetical protein
VATGTRSSLAPPSGAFYGTRPLKRWRYVGVFCEPLMACAAIVHVGPFSQSFWAVYMRAERELLERTRLAPRRSELQLQAGTLRVRDRGVVLELELLEDGGIEALCRHGRGSVWTRKQAGVPARGTLTLPGRTPCELEARAVIDDTAGHHARRTEWHWSAGVGADVRGRSVAWNLVSGVNDPPQGSERAVWVDGAPAETPPVSFAADLSSIGCVDGSELRFAAEAQRSRRDRMLLVSSYYRAPFGSFAGTLPGNLALQEGLGVMEHHRARW